LSLEIYETVWAKTAVGPLGLVGSNPAVADNHVTVEGGGKSHPRRYYVKHSRFAEAIRRLRSTPLCHHADLLYPAWEDRYTFVSLACDTGFYPSEKLVIIYEWH